MIFKSVCLLCATVTAMESALATSVNSEELTLSANVAPTPLAHAGVSVSVINHSQLQRLAPASIVDVLRLVPGIQVAGSGGIGAPTEVYVRGEDTHRTQLWIDGMPISNPASVRVAPVFSNVLAGRWQRVEVLRGPQGLPYGADAGGVVSLSTPSVDENFTADVHVQTGGYNSQQVDANVRARSGRFGYYLSGAHLATQGFNAREDDATQDFDGVQNTVWHTKVTLDVTAEQELKLVYRQVDQQLELDQCAQAHGAATALCGEDTAQRNGLLSWRYQSQNSAYLLAVSQSEIEVEGFAAQQLTGRERGGLQSWRYSGHNRFGEPLTLVWGVDYKTQTRAAALGEEEAENTYKGAYLEGLVSVAPNFHYTIATRFDKNDNYGDHTSYRFSTAYLIPTQPGTFRFTAAYGTGFRAPSLLEQHNALPAVLLTEEHSHGGELGLEWLGRGLTVGAVAFQTKIEDRIGQLGSGYTQIDGVSSSKGLELFATVAMGEHLRLSSNYTFNETQANHQEDVPRALRPQNVYNVALLSDWWGDAWQFDVSARGVRYAQRNALLLEDYDVVSLSSRYKVTEQWYVHLRVENAADAVYQEAPGYATSRRKAYVGMQISF